jgi:hypothetical protein
MIKDENTPEVEQDENKINEEETTKDETEDESSDQKESESKDDDTDWKAEALKQKAINDRLNKRLGKPNDNKPSKSDEFGYDKKAFLTANGIKGTKEFDFVKDEVKKSGMELEDLLENDYFQSKLDKFRALNKTAEATIKGKDSKGVQTDSVEYWLNKPIEEVPHEMRIKVVNAKLKQNESKGKFYNSK